MQMDETTVQVISEENRPDTAKRRETVLPLFENVKIWLDKKQTQIPPSLIMEKVVNYALNQWPFLIAYLDCVELTTDYLHCLFEQAPLCNADSELEQLLPWNITISKFQK